MRFWIGTRSFKLRSSSSLFWSSWRCCASLLGDMVRRRHGCAYWNVIQIVIGGVIAILILLIIVAVGGMRWRVGRVGCSPYLA